MWLPCDRIKFLCPLRFVTIRFEIVLFYKIVFITVKYIFIKEQFQIVWQGSAGDKEIQCDHREVTFCSLQLEFKFTVELRRPTLKSRQTKKKSFCKIKQCTSLPEFQLNTLFKSVFSCSSPREPIRIPATLESPIPQIAAKFLGRPPLLRKSGMSKNRFGHHFSCIF